MWYTSVGVIRLAHGVVPVLVAVFVALTLLVLGLALSIQVVRLLF
ncbi:MAG: hypothetical protein ACREKK_11715 [Candidatus Methylomirabilales bacterium]